jgi:hypothetical protein
MPYQNRVDPFGNIHPVPERGLFTGNRGIIHDPATRGLLKRRWSSKAWIVCDCGYKGLRRDIMGANGPNGSPGWTNLFFLDEVTALAAGHRPCFACRRRAAESFAGHFADAFCVSWPKANEIDTRLHDERQASGGRTKPLKSSELPGLPDGTVIASGAAAWALRQNHALRWSFAGYEPPVPLSSLADIPLTLVTPPTIVAILRSGFRPVWHASATKA